ncbi:MAG: ATP-binding cassette domain-containing protein [Bacteroidales bacterium]|nr:ATP-binding cassette domain-containing protein [Bacteroidales bacterium]
MSVVEIKGVSKFYGKQKALNQVNINIDRGEVVGLLGPNGAGKSTLMKLLTSFISADEGEITIQGVNVREQSLKIRQWVGYLPENNPLYPEMYVREYLRFVYEMYPNKQRNPNRVSEMIDLTGLGPEQNKKIGALSKGYRQRVGLAQALIHDPEVLILDEPTSGLDPVQLPGIRSVISNLGKEKTVLLSTHVMQEVEAMCNRVVIINHGQIVADQSIEEFSEMKTSDYRYKLELKETINAALLLEIPFVQKVEPLSEKEWIIIPAEGKDIRESVFKFAVTHNLNILAFSRIEQKMEEIFRELTAGK